MIRQQGDELGEGHRVRRVHDGRQPRPDQLSLARLQERHSGTRRGHSAVPELAHDPRDLSVRPDEDGDVAGHHRPVPATRHGHLRL